MIEMHPSRYALAQRRRIRRFAMKTRRIPVMTKVWLAMALVLALLPGVGIAGPGPPLDQQLIEAAGRGNLEFVKTLLGMGANVNAEDDRGMTALMAAAGQGHVEVAQLLIERDADVNARDSAGETALMFAASRGLFEVVKLLVENGAALHEKAHGGETAMEMAQKNGDGKTVEFLKARTYVPPFGSTWRGVVISSTPRAIGVRVLGATGEVVMFRSKSKDNHRQYPVGATVEAWSRYDGRKASYGFRVIDSREAGD